MSSYSSDTIAPWSYAVQTPSITSQMASLVECPFWFPICLSRRSLWFSAALAILWPRIPSISLPKVLSREIGL